MTEVEKPKVAEAKPEHQSDSSTDSESDEEIPELEDAGNANSGAGAFPGASATGLPIDMVSKAKQSRGEKKARKIMSKLGLKPVSTQKCYQFFTDFIKMMKIDNGFVYLSEYQAVLIVLAV